MNNETGVDVLPKKELEHGLMPMGDFVGRGLAVIFAFVVLAAMLEFGGPRLMKTFFPKPPPTEVERFISGDALVKDGVRVWIHTNKYYNLKEYTRLGDVPGLTQVYTWLRAEGYHNPGETDAGGPEHTRIWCEFGRFNGDFGLECTQLVSIEDPKNYMGMRMDLKTHDHLGEGVDWESFQVAFAKAVKALSQTNLGTLPMVK